MVRFLETVEEPALRDALSTALSGKGAFKRFKDVLVAYPKERKRWHGYNAKVLKQEITAWLGSVGVEPMQ
jgi:hypothetical protein